MQHLRNKFRTELSDRDSLTSQKLDDFINAFTDDVKKGTWDSSQAGWAERNTTYNVSKVAVNGYVTLLDRELSERKADAKIYVDSFCPGFTKTDMTEGKGSEDVAGAVATGVWLALREAGGTTGKFWIERQEHSWD